MTKVCATYEYLWVTWASTSKAIRILTGWGKKSKIPQSLNLESLVEKGIVTQD